MTETQKEQVHQIALYYGLEAQSQKTVEENIELAHALIRLVQGKISLNNDKDLYEVLEEIADVEIMIEQLKFLLSCYQSVSKIIDIKIKRQEKRIDNEWCRILGNAQKEGAKNCIKNGIQSQK